MVEYLIVPLAAVVLAGALAVQFLLTAVRYGPRSRRALVLLGAPAVAAGVAVGAAVSDRSLWPRLLLGALASAGLYLALATAFVLRWRDRKVAAIVGDMRAVRTRLQQRRQAAERLFWQRGGFAGLPPAPKVELAAGAAEEWSRVVRAWRDAEPAEVSGRTAQVSAWQAEFRRYGQAELGARARVLDAAWRDAPGDGERAALRARLGTLWLTLAGVSVGLQQAGAQPETFADLQDDLDRLEAELERVGHERQSLLRRRLPLD